VADINVHNIYCAGIQLLMPLLP